MIGIFDSGSGGLSVLQALRRHAPDADVVYFGDLKNAPYGNKSREELGVFTVLGIQKLIDEGATEILSACNSVSVSIVLPMFEILNLPHANIIEMVGPVVSSFRETDTRVLVVATQATAESGVYQAGFRSVGCSADVVVAPNLVTLIEAGATPAQCAAHIREVLAPQIHADYSHVVLGCTHYPLRYDVFRSVLNDLGCTASLVDPAEAVAAAVAERFDVHGEGVTRFLLSKQSAVFEQFAVRVCTDAPCLFETV